MERPSLHDRTLPLISTLRDAGADLLTMQELGERERGPLSSSSDALDR